MHNTQAPKQFEGRLQDLSLLFDKIEIESQQLEGTAWAKYKI